MKKILFIEFHNLSPHIETSFELAQRHLADGDMVKFVFLGHDVPFREHMFRGRVEAHLFRRWMPEQRAAKMIEHPNFEFVGGARLALESPTEAPDTLDELKSIQHRGADIGMGVASSLISRTHNSRFSPAAHARTVRRALAGAKAVYDYAHSLISEYRPSRVYLFNGRLCHPRAALRAAQHLGVDIGIHDRGADISRFVVRRFILHDRKKVQAEIANAWAESGDSGEAIAKAHEWFEDRRNGRPKDWFSFTTRQRPSHLPELPPEKRIVSYFSSSDDEFAAIGDEYEWKGWRDQIHSVESLIEILSRLPNSQLVVRIHPHLTRKHPDDLARWLQVGRGDDSVTVIGPESPVDSYALLEASDIVVTGGSTIGLEAVYWRKPSILLGPSDYDELNAVHIARSRDALKALLEREDLEVDPIKTLAYGHYRATYGQKFSYFTAYSLTGGRFLGRDLHELPPVIEFASRTKQWFLNALRSSSASPARQP